MMMLLSFHFAAPMTASCSVFKSDGKMCGSILLSDRGGGETIQIFIKDIGYAERLTAAINAAAEEPADEPEATAPRLPAVNAAGMGA